MSNVGDSKFVFPLLERFCPERIEILYAKESASNPRVMIGLSTQVKARQAAAGGTQAGAAYFDPWTNIQKQRSCPGGDEIVEVAPEIIAPVKKGDVEVRRVWTLPSIIATNKEHSTSTISLDLCLTPNLE